MAEPAAQNITLYVALISAGAALFGTVGGGLISFLTTYHLKKKEWLQEQVTKEIEKREKLYAEFRAECGELFLKTPNLADASTLHFSKAVSLMALIEIIASPKVYDAALLLVESSIRTSNENVKKEKPSLSRIFSKACRKELEDLKKGKSPW